MARVLDALDPDVLERACFRFGGGTRIALAHGEFRLSRDLDFLCSDARGYADVRATARARGYDGLFRDTTGLAFPREIRADQYGLRFPVLVGATSIRVELIREVRIELGPEEHAGWTSLPLLSIEDTFAEKLLANSDRWADRGDMARDLVDLAVLRSAHGPIPEAAWRAVAIAYRSGPLEDLRKAAAYFLAEPAFQERCFAGLDVVDGDSVRRGVELLVEDLASNPPSVPQTSDFPR